MRLYFRILFLTLVLSGLAANAAPSADSQPNRIEISPKDRNEPLYATDRVEYDWSARIGFLSGAISELNKSEQFPVYGIRFDLKKDIQTAWQIEAMLGKPGFLHVVLAQKNYFPLERWMMPYYRYGVGDSIDFQNGLGSVLNIKCIQAVGALGVDDIWERRLQAEVALSYALIGPQVEFSLGFAF